mmetsp:Transcript_56466/g.100578  ORF Transcript_56466/g.100578 Transcript_56466/m.100578 type:complete len:208 (-) Transcript_56466:463-1086(-)
MFAILGDVARLPTNMTQSLSLGWRWCVPIFTILGDVARLPTNMTQPLSLGRRRGGPTFTILGNVARLSTKMTQPLTMGRRRRSPMLAVLGDVTRLPTHMTEPLCLSRKCGSPVPAVLGNVTRFSTNMTEPCHHWWLIIGINHLFVGGGRLLARCLWHRRINSAWAILGNMARQPAYMTKFVTNRAILEVVRALAVVADHVDWLVNST